MQRRWQAWAQVNRTATDFPVVASALGLTDVMGKLGGDLLIQASALNPDLDRARAMIRTSEGKWFVLKLQVLPIRHNLSTLGLPTAQETEDPRTKKIDLAVNQMRSEPAGSGSTERRLQGLIGENFSEKEPLEVVFGPVLKEWATTSPKDLFIRLPDWYFTDRFRVSAPSSLSKWSAQKLEADPFVSIQDDGDDIVIHGNGDSPGQNVNRESLKTNILEWTGTKSPADYLARSIAFEGSWRINPESVLGPIFARSPSAWFDRSADSIKVLASFNLQEGEQPLRTEALPALFNLARWHPEWVTSFGDAFSEKTSGIASEIPLSRVFGGFDGDTKVVITVAKEPVFEVPTELLIGHSFGPGLASFGAFRAAYLANWEQLPGPHRVGELLATTRYTVFIGKAHSTGLKFDVTVTDETKPFDLITLEGLPEPVREAVSQAIATKSDPDQKP
jgi:hypothetical protein